MIPRITIIQKQEGVFRTNCMDCLDRTNVVQSVIGRNILLSQLHYVDESNSRLVLLRGLMEILSKSFPKSLREYSENPGLIMQTRLAYSILVLEHSKLTLLLLEREQELEE